MERRVFGRPRRMYLNDVYPKHFLDKLDFLIEPQFFRLSRLDIRDTSLSITECFNSVRGTCDGDDETTGKASGLLGKAQCCLAVAFTDEKFSQTSTAMEQSTGRWSKSLASFGFFFSNFSNKFQKILRIFPRGVFLPLVHTRAENKKKYYHSLLAPSLLIQWMNVKRKLLSSLKIKN